MLELDPALSSVAFDAVCIIVEQGLVHPILCTPALVAIQTCNVGSISDRASVLYDNLAEKHQTFIHTKNMESLRLMFDYQTKILSVGQNLNSDTVWVPGL